MSWRYVKPANKMKPYDSTDGKKWWWCNLRNKGNDGAYCMSHDTNGSLSGKAHDPNWGTNTAPASHLAEGEEAALELIPRSVSTGQPVRTRPLVEAESLPVIELLF
jgi:hypothetical protein